MVTGNTKEVNRWSLRGSTQPNFPGQKAQDDGEGANDEMMMMVSCRTDTPEVRLEILGSTFLRAGHNRWQPHVLPKQMELTRSKHKISTAKEVQALELYKN